MDPIDVIAEEFNLKESRSNPVFRGNCPRPTCDGVNTFTIRRFPNSKGQHDAYCRECRQFSAFVPPAPPTPSQAELIEAALRRSRELQESTSEILQGSDSDN